VGVIIVEIRAMSAGGVPLQLIGELSEARDGHAYVCLQTLISLAVAGRQGCMAKKCFEARGKVEKRKNLRGGTVGVC
jgi:hypothetical protein